MYQNSQEFYRQLFKKNKKTWRMTEEELLRMPENTLGRALGDFYQTNNLKMIPKFENHDVYHLLSHMGTNMRDEIAMQFLLLGNGKISLYLLGTITLGTLVFPEDYKYYQMAYFKSQSMPKFYHLDFEKLLHQTFVL